jgi:pimeloyl-ACP methyl ester carboxylesterase
VALQALPAEPRIECAVLISPIASLEAASRSTVGHMLPLAGPFFFDSICERAQREAGYHVREVNTLAAAREVKIPVLVIHGRKDWKVPLGQGRAVFDGLGSQEKEFYEADRAGHDNLWDEANTELRQKVRGFFARHLRQ